MSAASTGAAPVAAEGQALRRRLQRWFAVVGALLVVVVALALVAYVQQVRRQEALTQNLFDAISRTDVAYISLIDAESALRGYALTGDSAARQAYLTARGTSVPFVDIAADVTLVRDDPATRAAAERAQALAQAWYVQSGDPLVEQIAVRGPGSVREAQLEESNAGFDEVRAAVDDFVVELRASRAGVADELTAWTQVASVVVLILVAAIVVLGVATWVALRRWVLAPIEAVGADVRQVASGRLDHPVTTRGPGEVATLARDVEQMRTTLVDQMARVQAAHAQVERAHAQLADQAEELRRSNRDLEQFAYVASHDLQEPLRKVASFTQLLQKRYAGQLDERADQYIAFAVDGAKRMQRLIQDLLGFSRVGRLGREVGPVDLGAALREALDQQSEAITETGAVVTYDDLPTVQGEEPLLVQLFANLVGNAVKFHRPGSPARVHVSARTTDGGVELACEDDGIGIDPQYAERVFVIFQRLHPKDVYEGTGIGLALCKKIIEFHGGRIWLEQPESGVGTRVCWTLPVTSTLDGTDAPDPDVATPTPHASSSTAGPTATATNGAT